MATAAPNFPIGTDALRVLVAAGDRLTVEHAAQTLEQNGFTVLRAIDDASAVEQWQRDGPDVILVDVELPSRGGFELCRQIRETSRTPVIMVAADAVESDVIRGYISGADDFVVHPFGSQQLAWRIRAIHGRYLAAPLTRSSILAVGDLTLDLDQHEVVRGSARVGLTPTEFRIFRKLAANAGEVVGYSRLFDSAWPGKAIDPEGIVALKSHIAHIRRKLRELGGHPRQIGSVARQGYLLPLNQTSSRSST
jgi:two-component system response regulator MtrA